MILVEGITKSYQGQPALKGVTLSVRPGEAVALVGPNGAGKSTLLRVIAGLIRPAAGTTTINGISSADPRARSSLGYLPQRPGVPSSTSLLSLARLVTGFRGLPPEAIDEIFHSSRLEDRRGAAIGELSGGQRQRFMLSLATRGPVTALLLDEPGISLDSEGADDVHSSIRQARARGCAVLFASHHLLDVAALADRVAIMLDGAVVADGTLAELARRCGVAWTGVGHPPVETVYRTLVTRTRRAIREVA
jgi:ABC-type multidrug transport system ATPase subunit